MKFEKKRTVKNAKRKEKKNKKNKKNVVLIRAIPIKRLHEAGEAGAGASRAKVGEKCIRLLGVGHHLDERFGVIVFLAPCCG